MNFIKLILALMVTSVLNVHADGGNSGGGGVFIELDVSAVRTFLYNNCEQFESFKKHQVDCVQFKKKMDEVGALGQGLSIADKALKLDDGKPVDAINYKNTDQVEIGGPSWKSAGPDMPLKVGLQAHENLSLMGLEHTGYYDISRDLVVELRTSGRFPMLSPVAPKTINWIRKELEGIGPEDGKDFGGKEDGTGRDCGLYLTNKSIEGSEDYFVVVGYHGDKLTEDDYVGVIAREAQGERSEGEVTLDSKHPWGNDTKFNNLKIQTNVFGDPISAIGKSDKRSIRCILDGTSGVRTYVPATQ